MYIVIRTYLVVIFWCNSPCYSILVAWRHSDANVYSAERADKCAGAFYGGDGSTLAVGLVFLLALIAWTVVTCMALFLGIKYTIGIRVSEEVEVRGHPCACFGKPHRRA